MKPILQFICLFVVLVSSQAADSITPDLKAAAEGKKSKTFRVTAEWVQDDGGKPALKLKTTPGVDGFIILDDITFTNGVIEFDARGRSAPFQSNFLGLAFRVKDDQNYDAIYFRPFNFRAAEAEKRSHSVQYMSLPDWGWPRLRAERTGQFEKAIDPAPDGDAWFHVRIVIEKPKLTVFVNGSKKPALAVNELTMRTAGSVGFWCNGFGSFANLTIMPKP